MVVDYAAVLVEVRALVVAAYPVPIVPPRRDAGSVVFVHVLANEDRPVALVLQPGGRRRALAPQLAELPRASLRPPVAEYLVVVSVLAAQDRGPARAA